ncbi:hypothetical protein PtB15_15B143 [Puccinia triticina]|nr:hypothetical protein PtB15_15B143 [Puccinia triticina]
MTILRCSLGFLTTLNSLIIINIRLLTPVATLYLQPSRPITITTHSQIGQAASITTCLLIHQQTSLLKTPALTAAITKTNHLATKSIGPHRSLKIEQRLTTPFYKILHFNLNSACLLKQPIPSTSQPSLRQFWHSILSIRFCLFVSASPPLIPAPFSHQSLQKFTPESFS